jgi:hypothetical protein
VAPNPLRTEREAFQVLVWILVVFVVAVVAALIIQAL